MITCPRMSESLSEASAMLGKARSFWFLIFASVGKLLNLTTYELG